MQLENDIVVNKQLASAISKQETYRSGFTSNDWNKNNSSANDVQEVLSGEEWEV